MSPPDDAAEPSQPKAAEPATRTANTAVLERLPFDDVEDFAAARRGFVGTIDDGMVRNDNGNVVWNLNWYDFLADETAPDTVNPSLWRIARLNMAHGLFEVADGVYQVRGLDLANMTIIEGDSGVIVIDPLTVAETARAALQLYYAHRTERPVLAVVYSHSHVDHYGGVKGVLSDAMVERGAARVFAPDGFMEAVAGENVLAGNAMLRRAQFQFGALLPPGERGQVDAGLGKGVPRGSTGLIAPTDLITEPLEHHVIDGVEIDFHLAPETEAPAEMHMFLPRGGVLNMAENATRHLHNFCPLRGAVVRDPRMWAHYLGEARELFGDRVEVLIGQHHWPTWGREEVRAFLAKQRDLYKHVHDQTVRLMNLGYRPAEIAEVLDLPPELAAEWSVRGYYGTISHNSKAVYQRYLSWYDGNPANLNPLPPQDTAAKTVAYMGGADAVIAHARDDFAQGEFRWVAQAMNQVVFAEPDNRAARELGADALEQLGYQAESATWRNAYLYGAQELRRGVLPLPPRPMLSPDVLQAVTTATLFDFMAVRLNPDRVDGRQFAITWVLTGSDEVVAQNLENSTLSQVVGRTAEAAAATVTTDRETLIDLILRRRGVAEAQANGRLKVDGDAGVVAALFVMLDDFSLQFDVLTPGPR